MKDRGERDRETERDRHREREGAYNYDHINNLQLAGLELRRLCLQRLDH